MRTSISVRPRTEEIVQSHASTFLILELPGEFRQMVPAVLVLSLSTRLTLSASRTSVTFVVEADAEQDERTATVLVMLPL